MGRDKKRRCCRSLGSDRIFKPAAVPLKKLDIIDIGLDQFEALRLCDLEGKDQTEAAQQMGVSRGTVQRLLKSGRANIVCALLDASAIRIKNYEEMSDDSMSANSRK